MVGRIVFNTNELKDYDKGRISGITYALIYPAKRGLRGWLRRKKTDELMWEFEATEEQFVNVVTAIDNAYPGMIQRSLLR